MKLWVVAVGQKVPAWAQTAWDEYAKRFPPDIKLTLKTVKTEPRSSKTLPQIWTAEKSRIEAVLPKDCHRIWLDEKASNSPPQVWLKNGAAGRTKPQKSL